MPISPFCFSFSFLRAWWKKKLGNNGAIKVGKLVAKSCPQLPPDKMGSNNTFLLPITSSCPLLKNKCISLWKFRQSSRYIIQKNKFWGGCFCYCKVRRTLGDFARWLFLLRRIGPSKPWLTLFTPHNLFHVESHPEKQKSNKTLEGHSPKLFAFCCFF